MTEHKRINLDEASESRAPIDANWSRRKKMTVGIVAAICATSAVSAGVWWTMASRPPRLPRTADEAVVLLASSQFDRLSEDRQRQYAAEAGRLMRELPDEERRALFQDESNRDAMRKVFEERMDEMVRNFARGEEMNRGRFPRGERPPRAEGEEGRPPFNPEEMTDEERQRRMDERKERMNEQILTNAQSGNAQSSGLRAEMMKRMTKSGGGWGGGGRGGGGGGGGAGGPRGG